MGGKDTRTAGGTGWSAAECGRPGRLYPWRRKDAEVLAAAWNTGMVGALFWRTTMSARCDRHAPPIGPVALFAGQSMPCDWVPPARIQRRRTKGWQMPPGAVTVTRPTMWGNPFVIGQAPGCGGNQTAVAMHRAWLEDGTIPPPACGRGSGSGLPGCAIVFWPTLRWRCAAGCSCAGARSPSCGATPIT